MARDRDDDATPATSFAPAKTATYTITLTLEAARRASFCALILMRKGGYDVPVDNLKDALVKAILLGARANDQMGGAKFHEEPNQWSLFGTILAPATAITLNRLRLEPGQHVVVAAADDSAKDVDLVLTDKAGRVIAKDDDDDATPVVGAATDGQPYNLQIKNHPARAPALVIATVLDVPPEEDAATEK